MNKVNVFSLLFSCLLSFQPAIAGGASADDAMYADINRLCPPAPSRFALHANEQNLVSGAAMQQFSQPKLETQQAVTVRLPDKTKLLKNGLGHQLSALGFVFNSQTGAVLYVDRYSDLYTHVFQGDVYLTEDSVPGLLAWKQHRNLGNEQTPVHVEFLQHGIVHEYICMRHPTRWFGLFWHQSGNLRLP